MSVKIATTLDGKIATSSYDSKWITNDLSRMYAHRLRAQHDCIIVGMNTVRKDDPMLTCRLPGINHNPVRVILDTRGELSKGYKVIDTSAEVPTIVLTSNNDYNVSMHETCLHVEEDSDGKLSIASVLEVLKRHEFQRIFVEPGGSLFKSLLKADCIDQLFWFRAPSVVGGSGVSSVGVMDIDIMRDAHRFIRSGGRLFGDCIMDVLEMRNEDFI